MVSHRVNDVRRAEDDQLGHDSGEGGSLGPQLGGEELERHLLAGVHGEGDEETTDEGDHRHH